jgi:hypothetical protein
MRNKCSFCGAPLEKGEQRCDACGMTVPENVFVRAGQAPPAPEQPGASPWGSAPDMPGQEQSAAPPPQPDDAAEPPPAYDYTQQAGQQEGPTWQQAYVPPPYPGQEYGQAGYNNPGAPGYGAPYGYGYGQPYQPAPPPGVDVVPLWTYVWPHLLLLVPYLGWVAFLVVMFLWAFGASYGPNRKNFARANLIVAAGALVLLVIAVAGVASCFSYIGSNWPY